MSKTINKEGLEHLAEVLDEKYQPLGEYASKAEHDLVADGLAALDGRVPWHEESVTECDLMSIDEYNSFVRVQLKEGKEYTFVINGKERKGVAKMVKLYDGIEILAVGNAFGFNIDNEDSGEEFYVVDTGSIGESYPGFCLASMWEGDINGYDTVTFLPITSFSVKVDEWHNKLPIDAIDWKKIPYKEVEVTPDSLNTNSEGFVVFRHNGKAVLEGDTIGVVIDGKVVTLARNKDVEDKLTALSGDEVSTSAWGNGKYIGTLSGNAITSDDTEEDMLIYITVSGDECGFVLLTDKYTEDDLRFLTLVQGYEGSGTFTSKKVVADFSVGSYEASYNGSYNCWGNIPIPSKKKEIAVYFKNKIEKLPYLQLNGSRNGSPVKIHIWGNGDMYRNGAGTYLYLKKSVITSYPSNVDMDEFGSNCNCCISVVEDADGNVIGSVFVLHYDSYKTVYYIEETTFTVGESGSNVSVSELLDELKKFMPRQVGEMVEVPFRSDVQNGVTVCFNGDDILSDIIPRSYDEQRKLSLSIKADDRVFFGKIENYYVQDFGVAVQYVGNLYLYNLLSDSSDFEDNGKDFVLVFMGVDIVMIFAKRDENGEIIETYAPESISIGRTKVVNKISSQNIEGLEGLLPKYDESTGTTFLTSPIVIDDDGMTGMYTILNGEISKRSIAFGDDILYAQGYERSYGTLSYQGGIIAYGGSGIMSFSHGYVAFAKGECSVSFGVFNTSMEAASSSFGFANYPTEKSLFTIGANPLFYDEVLGEYSSSFDQVSKCVAAKEDFGGFNAFEVTYDGRVYINGLGADLSQGYKDIEEAPYEPNVSIIAADKVYNGRTTEGKMSLQDIIADLYKRVIALENK